MTDAVTAGPAARPVGGVLAVAVAATVWGTTGTATHFAPGVPAVVFGAVTFGLGGLVLAASAGGGTVRAIANRTTRPWVVLGAVALVVYAVAFYAALAGAGVALGTTVAIGSSPVCAGVVEWVAERRPVGRRWVAATGVSVLGMVLVTVARPSESGGGAGPVALGVLAALVAGLTYALYSWSVARGMGAGAASGPASAGRARGVVGAVFGLAAVPLVVLALATGHDALATPGNWPVFAYLALVPTVLGHLLYAVGLRSVRASVATLTSLLEPVVAAVLAVLVVGEHLGPAGWSGVVLVVLGVGLLAVPTRSARVLP